MNISTQLNKIIENRHLLKHPFYQAWSTGTLDLDILKRYAAQYYSHVECFPRFISRVHAECPVIEARKILVENLADEEIHGTDHPTLWMQFAEGLGASRTWILNDKPIPETKALIDTFNEIAARDWRDGLCALYAYEFQVPEVSASKIEGLEKFYKITDARSIKFFTAHQTYDVEHARQISTLINKYVEPEQALLATQEAVDALWGFLDGMCRIGNLECEKYTNDDLLLH